MDRCVYDGFDSESALELNPQVLTLTPRTSCIFQAARDEARGEWRKLHNEELSELCALPNIVRVVKSRRMRWAGHVARMGDGSGVHRILIGKPEGKRPLGRPRRRWEDNINMYLSGSGRGLWGLDGVGSG